MNRQKHWQRVYSDKQPEDHSWFQSDPRISLELIQASALTSDGRILDVGGGSSLLVDRLLDLGFDRPGVLDVSENALNASKERLGNASEQVEWVVSDVLTFEPAAPWDLWHDRAVFHFLVDPDDRERYRDVLYRTVPIGGHVIVATFGPDGPERCSGLDTIRCSAADIARELGPGVKMVEERADEHRTPQGSAQHFIYARLVRVAEVPRA